VIFSAFYIMGLNWGCAKIEHVLSKIAYNLLDGFYKRGFWKKKAINPNDFGRSQVDGLESGSKRFCNPLKPFLFLIESPCRNQESVMEGGDFIG
jgi:hypothetical protein